jgi:tetratricopeptide (TPR) repeat protein
VTPFLVGVLLVLLPVAARNYSVAGGWYLTTSQFGSNLYIGNHPGAHGSYVALREGRGSPEYERLDATELAEADSGRRLIPSEVSGYWTAKTLAYIESQPGDWLRLLGRKARLLVSSTEIVDTESQESHAEYSWPLRVLGPLWHFGLLLPLAIVGAAVWWPDRRRVWPLYALTAVYAASVVLFFVVARYRLPLVPIIIVFAALGAVTLVESLTRAAPKAALRPGIRIAIVIATLGGILANWPLHTAASQQAITENNLGTALQEEGRPEEAIDRYKRALALQSDYTPAMNNLGTALRAAGRVDEAVAVYDDAVRANAGGATLQLNRGNALMAQGKMEEAIAAFRQAVALDPNSAHARDALARALYDFGTAAIEAQAFDRAIVVLRDAIAVKRDYAEAHNNLGIALASLGRLPEAIAEWEAALRIKPDFADARRNLELARK